MFPFTVTCTSKIEAINGSIDKSKGLAYLNNYIEKYKGEDIYISENQIFFKPKFRIFASGWYKFSNIEQGEFVLTDNTVSFKFSMYRLLIITTIMSAFMGFSSHEVFVGVFFFLGLVGGNWIINFIKFRNMTNELATALSNM